MFKKILLFLAVIVGAFLAYVAFKPAELNVARSAVIPASADAIFPHVNNLKKWEAWSPWAKLDPNATLSYSGPEAGLGAVHTWAGNEELGAGKITIVESRPNQSVKFRLDFLKPFESTANSDIDLVAEGAGTKVTWSFSGKHGFFERAICTLMMVDLDGMIGAEYEKGLATLADVVASPGA